MCEFTFMLLMAAKRRMHFPIRPNPLIAIVGVPQPNDSFTFSLDLDGLQLVNMAEDALDRFFNKAEDELLHKFFAQPRNSSLTICKNDKLFIILKVANNNLNNNTFRRENTSLVELDDYNIIIEVLLIFFR